MTDDSHFADFLREHYKPRPWYANWWVAIPALMSFALTVMAIWYAIAAGRDARACAKLCGPREYFVDISGRCLCAEVAP